MRPRTDCGLRQAESSLTGIRIYSLLLPTAETEDLTDPADRKELLSV